MPRRTARFHRAALFVAIGVSACGSVPTDATPPNTEAVAGLVDLPSATEPLVAEVAVPEHVASCVDHALYQAFFGNQFWQDVWNDTGQDEQALAKVCEGIGRTDPVQLDTIHQEWMAIEASLATADQSAPVDSVPPAEPVQSVQPIAPTAPLIEVTSRFNAEGNDNDNKNDEWVRFTNAGTAPVDISGWNVTDGGEKHQYRFASLVIDPGASVTLFTGCGSDTKTERFWCNSGSAIWNNDGDVMSLFDAAGTLITQHAE